MNHAPYWLLGATTLALLACQADRVSTPRANKPAAAERSTTAPPPAPADLALLGASLDDAADRLAPALVDQGAAAQLAPQLRLLSAALATGDAARARSALQAARAALDRAGQTPDAAAIGLALDRAEALIPVEGPGHPAPAAAEGSGALH